MEEYWYMEIYSLATSVVPDTGGEFTATVIIAGLGIVLSTLALLIVVFKLFGNIMEKSQQSKKKKQAQKQLRQMEQEAQAASSVSASAPIVEKSAVQEGISGEIIAAISAAVYAIEGPNAVVRSVTRKKSPVSSRNPWAQAAINDNTRPF